MSAPVPSFKWYRITGVPSGVNERDLRAALDAIHPSLRSADFGLKLYPSIKKDYQTVLLYTNSSPQYFQTLKDDQPNPANIRLGSGTAGQKDIEIAVDSTFYNLTQLNAPTGNVIADVIAVTGLGGHAYGSWRSRSTKSMWLQEFLPETFNNVRIMTYGYDSKLVGEAKVQSRMLDYRKDFIAALKSSRHSPAEKKRPIIFLGQSLGGLLIVEALSADSELAAATQCIMFFGAPHKGLDTSDLEVMANAVTGPWKKDRVDLVKKLREDSECLEKRLVDFVKALGTMRRDLSVISFYEQSMTNKFEMTSAGTPRVSEELTMRAKRYSSVLFVPDEERVGVQENHTNMVKFDAPNNKTYVAVVKFLGESLKKIEKSVGR